jgi:aryl-alcohol dehydrogenase-like predicted oxidoreductase
MKTNVISKICLGTAQFGFDYGIANQRGKIPRDEVYEILAYATLHNIGVLDTAYAYGDSEEVIGSFIQREKKNIKIVSKFPALKNTVGKSVEDIVAESRKRLQVKKFHGYLVHDVQDVLNYPELWDAFKALKISGISERIGFSLYRPEELEILFKKDISFDIIQVPYSVFDRRFERYFSLLTDRGVEIMIRSVFLQGFAFLNPEHLQEPLSRAQKQLCALKKISSDTTIPISALCVCFAAMHQAVNYVVVGVDSLEHLRAHVNTMNLNVGIEKIYDRLNVCCVNDEQVLIPSQWRKS